MLLYKQKKSLPIADKDAMLYYICSKEAGGDCSVIVPRHLPSNILVDYSCIHCYLDNDDAGYKATQRIINAYTCLTIDESHRYSNYKDVNDVINGITKLA